MKQQQPELKIGDMIEWSFSSGGYRGIKRGHVIAEVPAHEGVREIVRKLKLNQTHYTNNGLRGAPREEKSYLVSAPSKIGTGQKPKLYWPRTQMLRVQASDEPGKLLPEAKP
jgi:hypothetical protein